jgi:hypothetical protein
MQRYSYSLAVRIWHPSLNPEEITRELGITPHRTCLAGDRRKTPKGQLLDGAYQESYWSADAFSRGEYSSTDDLAEDALDEVLQFLAPHRSFLQRLRSEGARLHLQVSSFSGRNYAFEFPPGFLAKCVDLGLSFVHDVYPYAQNW